jgi:predicted ATP-dependent endonuclease of OLD family
MKIQVKNLGNLAEAELLLDKELFILAGSNNAGKSYLAYLIYGLLKIKENKPANSLYQNYKKTFYKYFDKENILKRYVTKKGLRVHRFALFKHHYSTFVKARNQVFYDSMIEVFASTELRPTINVSGTYPPDSLVNKLEVDETIQIHDIHYRRRIHNDWFELSSEDHNESYLELIKSQLYDFLLSSNTFNLYFFPAERSAFHLLSEEVFKKFVLEKEEQSSNHQTIKKVVKYLQRKKPTIPRYPLAIRDYFSFIFHFTMTTHQPSEYAYLADDIEEQLMQGQVLITGENELQFQPQASNCLLPLYLSSSLVKSLSGLVIYFRYAAKNQDIIIIDIPELNLHPALQRIMARILAKAINNGLRIIISTHSEYLIKEFNNLIMLNKESNPPSIKEALLTQLQLAPNMTLDSNRVTGYFFTDNQIQPMQMTDTGFTIETVNEVSTHIEAAKTQIYSQLFKLE